MSEVEFPQRVQKANQWSKVVALFVAMGLFTASVLLTDEIQASSITAATAGIGARFLIPYQISQMVPEDKRIPIEEHPAAGNFHHGAVGVGLLVGAVVTTVAMAFFFESTFSLAIGGVAAGLVYFPAKEVMPRG